MSCLGSVAVYRCDACGRTVIAACDEFGAVNGDAQMYGYHMVMRLLVSTEAWVAEGARRTLVPALALGDNEPWRQRVDGRCLCPAHPDEPGIGLPAAPVDAEVKP